MGQPGSVNTILHEVIIPHVDNLPFSGIEVCQEAIMASYHGQQQLHDQEVISIPLAANLHLICADSHHIVTDLTSRCANFPTDLPISCSVHNASTVETTWVCCTGLTAITSPAPAEKTPYACSVHDADKLSCVDHSATCPPVVSEMMNDKTRHMPYHSHVSGGTIAQRLCSDKVLPMTENQSHSLFTDTHCPPFTPFYSDHDAQEDEATNVILEGEGRKPPYTMRCVSIQPLCSPLLMLLQAPQPVEKSSWLKRIIYLPLKLSQSVCAPPQSVYAIPLVK